MKILTTFTLLLLVIFGFYCCVESTKPVTAVPVTYAGTEKCQSCHAKEYSSYLQSDHFHAMDSALPRSVKGDFNNSFFVYYGDTSFFYQRDGRYYVRTKDTTGKKTEFPVSFTFGWQPLQQYLVRFDDGRIQTLPFCWDTRPKENGGQRWFHIYGKEKILPDDELFWMGVNQNWNNMCADCHTTNFFKNFDIADNKLHSTWSENKVSCESCHGPASAHLAWAEKKYDGDSLKGFAMNLGGKNVSWKFDTAKGIAYPSEVVQNTTLIETCARCHTRATHLSDYYYHGQSFLQTHLPSTVNTSSYYIDGQIKDEDYEYGSFLQSKMYAIGVTCINCHDPHTMQLKATQSQVCFTCHQPTKFDVPEHTHHEINSTGAQCINCHMPVTNYMVIDARRDHSIRIPRPDLSLTMGTPNACNKCHTDKSTDWAAKSFLQWYGSKLPKEKTYGQLLYTISKNTDSSAKALHDLLTGANYPPIMKATALEQYPQFYSKQIADDNKFFLQSKDPYLRVNALRAQSGLPPEIIIPLVTPLLNDPVLAVRTEAMNTLLPLYTQLDVNTKQRFDYVMNEYLAIQRYLSDRPEGYLNQGLVYAATGKIAEAERVYLLGIKRYPKFVPVYANLADLYRSQKNETKCAEYINKGLAIQPNNGELHYALGLWHIRNQDKNNGLEELRKSAEIDPSNATFVYGYAVGLQSVAGQPQKAIALLQQFVTKQGNNPVVLNGLIEISNYLKQDAQATYYQNVRQRVFGY